MSLPPSLQEQKKKLELTWPADFNLDATTIGINAALISAGCIIASPFVSPIVDKWGRKAGMAVGSCCIILGVILQASAKQSRSLICVSAA